MHTDILHLIAMLVPSHLQSFTFSLFDRYIHFFSFMPITFEIVHIWVSIHNTNAYEVFSDSDKYFTFSKHICSFTSVIIYISLFGSHICFAKTYEMLTDINRYFTFESYICFSHLWSLCIIFWQAHLFFPSFILITFELYSQVHLYTMLMHMKYSVSHKYFTFGSPICFFTPMITYVFFVWQTYFCNLHQ